MNRCSMMMCQMMNHNRVLTDRLFLPVLPGPEQSGSFL